MRSTRLFVATLILALPLLAADAYKIDPVHSEISFRVRHLGLSKVYGRFQKFSGDIAMDEKDLSKSTVAVAIEAASVDTGNADRDKHLLSPDFFDKEKFPTLTFKSVAVKEVSKGKLEVTGDFTLHGVTKRLTIPITSMGATSNPQMGTRAGFEGSLILKRSDYGMTSYPGMVGDEVSITLDIEAVKAEAKQ